MRKIVLDTNCLLMSLPRISPYRKISWSYYCGIKEIISFTTCSLIQLRRVKFIVFA